MEDGRYHRQAGVEICQKERVLVVTRAKRLMCRRRAAVLNDKGARDATERRIPSYSGSPVPLLVLPYMNHRPEPSLFFELLVLF